MNDQQFTALGIDVGGTKIAAGIVTFPEGRVRVRREVPTRTAQGADAVLRDVLELATALAADASALNLRVSAIGLGICELVSTGGDIVSANCLAWNSANVRETLAPIAPVIIEADVRAAALAEAIFGAGKPHRLFVYVTVGTGISSCLVVEGRPFTGARGATGTVASSPLPAEYGAGMTLEQIAAGPALVERFQKLGGRVQCAQEVVSAAQAGSADALSVLRSAGEALGATIAWLVNVLDPEAVVIGGGLGLSEGPYWEILEASARRHVWSDLHRHLPIVRAQTGLDAGVIGAAATAWMKCG